MKTKREHDQVGSFQSSCSQDKNKSGAQDAHSFPGAKNWDVLSPGPLDEGTLCGIGLSDIIAIIMSFQCECFWGGVCQAGNSVLGRGNGMSPAPSLYQGFFAGNVCWPIPSMVLGWGDPVGPRNTCGSSLGVDGIAWGAQEGQCRGVETCWDETSVRVSLAVWYDHLQSCWRLRRRGLGSGAGSLIGWAASCPWSPEAGCLYKEVARLFLVWN